MSATVSNSVGSDKGDKAFTQEAIIFSCDDMVDAYFIGKRAGQDSVFSIMKEKVNSNVTKMVELCELLFKGMNDLGIPIYNIGLKITNLINHDVAIIVKDTDYLSPKFDKVYDLSYDLTHGIKDDNFNLCFYFIPKTKNLDLSLMNEDGYRFYAPQTEKQAPRARRT